MALCFSSRFLFLNAEFDEPCFRQPVVAFVTSLQKEKAILLHVLPVSNAPTMGLTSPSARNP